MSSSTSAALNLSSIEAICHVLLLLLWLWRQQRLQREWNMLLLWLLLWWLLLWWLLLWWLLLLLLLWWLLLLLLCWRWRRWLRCKVNMWLLLLLRCVV
jgi:hypothetical protein